MKLIIDIPEKDLEFIKDLGFIGGFRGSTKTIQSNVINAIRNGKPYEETPSGDSISRSALKEEIEKRIEHDNAEDFDKGYNIALQGVVELIDNAPAVESYISPKVLNQFAKYVAEHERPQGECKSCRHCDPEDKKCDCGALERQGCPFPVSDDYYCKYYEKGGAE